jgi:2'-5' RNA ligase
MRAFLGLSLPEEIRESLHRLQRDLAASQADVKWVEAGNLHVTLKFLDEITEEQRRDVEALLTRLAGKESAFTLGVEEVGAFPSMRAPRVVWVGLSEGRDTVARMVQRIEEEGRAIGLRREARPFAAHLTLGRVRSSGHRQELTRQLQHITWKPPASWLVTSVTLYQSVLSSSGPTYHVLAEVPFKAHS